MSTKKKLIEATSFVRKGIYEGVDYTFNLVDMRHILDLLLRKQNTHLTHALLVNNGAKYERVQEWDETTYVHFYHFDFPLVLQRIGAVFFIAETDIQLKTVADLEDALDLCGIDKDIEL